VRVCALSQRLQATSQLVLGSITTAPVSNDARATSQLANDVAAAARAGALRVRVESDEARTLLATLRVDAALAFEHWQRISDADERVVYRPTQHVEHDTDDRYQFRPAALVRASHSESSDAPAHATRQRLACAPLVLPAFEARRAQLLRGLVRPPVAGVTVRAFAGADASQPIAETSTDATGAYALGPIDVDVAADAITLHASKSGYALHALPGSNEFAAVALAAIDVVVEDETGAGACVCARCA
jgi:hypothetical protein